MVDLDKSISGYKITRLPFATGRHAGLERGDMNGWCARYCPPPP